MYIGVERRVDMLTRDYSPSIGRFTTKDVVFGNLTQPLALNQFLYGLASPVSNADPTGMCADPAICPPMTGHGSSRHSREFRSRINENSARNDNAWAGGVDYEYTPAPPPPPPPPPPQLLLKRRDPDFVAQRNLSITGRPSVWGLVAHLLGQLAVQHLGARPADCLPRVACYEIPEGALGLDVASGTGFTLDHTIFCVPECTNRLLAHEGVHVEQHERYGPRFPLEYLGEARRHGVICDNRFEREAYRRDGSGRCRLYGT